MPSRALREHERDVIARDAQKSGLLASIAAGVVSSALVFAANRFSPRFRSALGVSGKTALIVTPTVGSFFLKSHLTVAYATANPTGYLGAADAADALPPGQVSGRLMPWHMAANAVYNNPFKSIFGTIAPLYGLIFYRESTHPSTANMLLSQRLIHTRVYGQAIAVLTTVTVMGLIDSMKDGPYVAAPVEAEVASSEASPDGSAGETDRGLGLLVPLFYAPLLPTMVVLLRGRVKPDTLHKIVLGTIAVALTHAGSYMFTDSSVI